MKLINGKSPMKKLWLIVTLTAGFVAGILVHDYYLGKNSKSW